MSLMKNGAAARRAAAGAAGIAAAAVILWPAAPSVAATTPAWHRVVTTKAELQDVTATGPGSAWAAASGPKSAYLLHWNGATWASQAVPHSDDFTPLSVQAPTAGVVWIIGQQVNQAGTQDEEAALIDDAGSWRKELLPQALVGGTAVVGNLKAWSMSGTSWCSSTAPAICNTSVSYWDNGVSASYPMPRTVEAITSAGGRAYVLTSSRAVFALTAAGPQRLPSAPGPIGQVPQLAASKNGHLWLLATGIRKSGPADSLYYFNGRKWSAQTVPAGPDDLTYGSGNMKYDDHGGVWLGPYTHWTGKAWTRTKPATVTASYDLQMVSAIPGSASAWSVGTNARAPGTSSFRTVIMVLGKLP